MMPTRTKPMYTATINVGGHSSTTLADGAKRSIKVVQQRKCPHGTCRPFRVVFGFFQRFSSWWWHFLNNSGFREENASRANSHQAQAIFLTMHRKINETKQEDRNRFERVWKKPSCQAPGGCLQGTTSRPHDHASVTQRAHGPFGACE